MRQTIEYTMRDDHAPQQALVADPFHLLFPVRAADDRDRDGRARRQHAAQERPAELDQREDVLDRLRHGRPAERRTRGLRGGRLGEQHEAHEGQRDSKPSPDVISRGRSVV